METIVTLLFCVNRIYSSDVHKANAILEKFVALIRQEREARGFTYEDLAAAAGLHRTTLALYDKGERGPSVEAALNMAAALDIPLSSLLRKAEAQADGRVVCKKFLSRREVPVGNFRNTAKWRQISGFSTDILRDAIRHCYQTLDTIDEQLTAHETEPISRLVELANLSSMIGNLLGTGLAKASNELYIRNKPHRHPDLISQNRQYADLEIKIALEKNKPKGHLPKAGNYITFRYVLCNDAGVHKKGKDHRGIYVFIWEVKAGTLTKADFDISNTVGDSGKTAVIKTDVFNQMPLIYFDPELLPYSSKSSHYPGFN